MTLSITCLKTYVPSRNFEVSQGFYRAMGFVMSEGWGGTADFALNGHCFRLQNYYVKDWAENFMMVIGVPDIEAWHRHARDVVASGRYAPARYMPPEPVDDANVLHVWDPCGVLLIFVQSGH